MRSPLPRPPTRPTSSSRPSRSVSVVTKLSLSGTSPVHQSGASVVATRSTPPSSDMENWFSSVPRTWPEPRYSVTLGEEVSNRWITVSITGGGVFSSQVTSTARCVAT